MTMRKWGALASFLLVAAAAGAGLIYLVGNLRDAFGPLGYALADFLYGPVAAASLVTVVLALRERIGERAQRCELCSPMSLALLAAVLAAATIVLVACIRASNRQYHLMYPELHLENSQTVLIVWTTLVSGVTAAAWHFLGWALVLIGSAGWTSGRLPRALSVLYLLGGVASLFVYASPSLAEIASLLGVILGIWQGIVLWKNEPGPTQTPEKTMGQPAGD